MKQVQTELFPDMQKPAHKKPEHTPLEKGFMQDVMDYASKIGLPNLHIDYYCGNKFFVECPCCGNKVLAECHKSNNQSNAGLPDIVGIAWGIETKREGFEPTELQIRTHERLRRQGVPILVASPENSIEVGKFLSNIKKEKSV